MRSMKMSQVIRGAARKTKGALLVAATLAGSLSLTRPAAAVGVDEPESRPKGTVGGALLGAEAVTLSMAAFGVRPGWAYLVGGGVGAIGGGVGGYFLEDSVDARASMLILAAGMVLAVPTTVVVLNATAYQPPADYIQDQAPPATEATPGEVPAATAPAVTGAASGRRRSAQRLERGQLEVRPHLPSLVGMDEGTWTLGVPALSLVDVYSPELRRTYDVPRVTELRVPVLAMRF
jgi:hypothetical protein